MAAIYKFLISHFGRGTTSVRGLTIAIVAKHLLTGMIFQGGRKLSSSSHPNLPFDCHQGCPWKMLPRNISSKTPCSQAHWQAQQPLFCHFFLIDLSFFGLKRLFFGWGPTFASCGWPCPQSDSRLHKRIETNVDGRQFFNRPTPRRHLLYQWRPPMKGLATRDDQVSNIHTYLRKGWLGDKWLWLVWDGVFLRGIF